MEMTELEHVVIRSQSELLSLPTCNEIGREELDDLLQIIL